MKPLCFFITISSCCSFVSVVVLGSPKIDNSKSWTFWVVVDVLLRNLVVVAVTAVVTVVVFFGIVVVVC